MKQIIILFGPPGAGKGTQAELLSDKSGLYYFETSKILEENFKKAENLSKNSDDRFIQVGKEKYDILNEFELWKKGELCSPPFVAYLVKKKIKELYEAGESLVIAGSPRTLFESQEVTPLLKELYGTKNIKVILIEISPEQTIFRNSNRKICELMRHPILYNKETEKLTVCPLDGSKLIKRKGLDDPESIRVRLKEYKNRTFPVIEYIENQGIKVKKINGEQSVADVYKNISKALK